MAGLCAAATDRSTAEAPATGEAEPQPQDERTSTGVGDVDGAELEALKVRIMPAIEAMLEKKEEALWRRGKVEINRLQHEQVEVKAAMTELQDRQAVLIAENNKIRGALVDVTTKFETVVKEMREVLRALTSRGGAIPAGGLNLNGMSSLPVVVHGDHLSPSPSAASTSASEVALDEQPSEPTPASTVGTWSNERSRQQPQTPLPVTPAQWRPARGIDGTAGMAAELPSFDSEDPIGLRSGVKTFCTPPRAGGVTESSARDDGSVGRTDTVAPPPPTSWRGTTSSTSPAVLSLASALPSASMATSLQTPPPAAINPSPCLKRLQLAACLEPQGTASVGATTTTASDSNAAASPPTLPRPCELSAPTPASTSTGARRFDFVTLEVVKEPGFHTLGIEVNQIDGSSLRVESIDEHGLVGRYNARQDSDQSRLCTGDRIIEVNGVRQDPDAMLQECKVQQRLFFTLHRGGSLPEEASADDENLTSGPTSPSRLRPEARVFVPSSIQAEASAIIPEGAATSLPVPPGLGGYDVAGMLSLGAHSSASPTNASLLATMPLNLPTADLVEPESSTAPAVALPTAAEVVSTERVHEAGAEQKEVKRALFP